MRVKRGTLTPGPCETCGTTESVEAHHEDFSAPAAVRWLCSRCHGAERYPEAQPGHRSAVSLAFERLATKYQDR